MNLLAKKRNASLSIKIAAHSPLNEVIQFDNESKVCTIPTKITVLVLYFPLNMLTWQERNYEIAEVQWMASLDSRKNIRQNMDLLLSLEVKFVNINTEEVFDSVLKGSIAPRRLGQMLNPILE